MRRAVAMRTTAKHARLSQSPTAPGIVLSRHPARRAPVKETTDAYERTMAMDAAEMGPIEWNISMRSYNMKVMMIMLTLIFTAASVFFVFMFSDDSGIVRQTRDDFYATGAFDSLALASSDYEQFHRPVINKMIVIIDRVATAADTVLTNTTIVDILNAVSAANHFMERMCISFNLNCDHPGLQTTV